MAAGVDPQTIISSARAYAAENKGNGKQYLLLSLNWLTAERWLDHAQQTIGATAAPEAVQAFWAKKVKAKGFIPSNAISASLARSMLNGGHVTAEELQAVGVCP
ncbi:MAG: hypothetical protein AAGM21_01760 [Pseudomonadota bacterium]